MLNWLKRFYARSLTNRAFFLVEQGDLGSAVALLKRAVKIDPTYGHGHNELSYVYGKSGQFDLGEESALRAIECDPQNPKFYNSLMGIFLERAKTLRTRKDIMASVSERLQQIDRAIASHPDYAPLHLSRALAMALGGESQEKWEAELVTTEQLYRKCSYAASGLPLQPSQVETIISRNRAKCLEMSSYYQRLS